MNTQSGLQGRASSQAARLAVQGVSSNAPQVVTTIRLQSQALAAAGPRRTMAQAGGRLVPLREGSSRRLVHAARSLMVVDIAARFVTLRSCRARCALLQGQPPVFQVSVQ